MRVPQGGERLLDSKEERPRQDVPYALDQAEPPSDPPEVGLGRRSVDEAQECQRNGRGADGVLDIRALGVLRLADNKLLRGGRAGIEEAVRALDDLALQVLVVIAQDEERGGGVEGEGLGRGRLDVSEIGRGDEGLDVGFEYVWRQLMHKALGVLAVADTRGRFTQRNQDFVLPDGL